MPDYIGEIQMRSGDTLPLFAVAIEDDLGVPVDISTATSVDILLTNVDGRDPRRWPGNPTVPLVLPGHIADAVHGLVTYDWNQADVLRTGVVDLALTVHLPGGILTAPTDRSARITVRPDAIDVPIYQGGSMPGRFDLYLYRGDSYGWQFKLWSDDARTVPVDLTDAAVLADMRNEPDGVYVVPLTSVITLPNIIDVAVSADASDRAPADGVWDLQLTFSDGEVATPLAGFVTTGG